MALTDIPFISRVVWNIVRMLPQAAKAKDSPAAAPSTSDTTWPVMLW